MLPARGVTPKQPYEPLYEYRRRHGPVGPKTGEMLYLEMPALDVGCFTPRRVWAHLPGEPRCDGVRLDAAHVGRAVKAPENVMPLFWPPCCPGLNPVEPPWLAVRERIDVFDAEVRSKLEALREHMPEIVRGFSAAEVPHLTGYAYHLEAARALQSQRTDVILTNTPVSLEKRPLGS